MLVGDWAWPLVGYIGGSVGRIRNLGLPFRRMLWETGGKRRCAFSLFVEAWQKFV